MFSAIEENTSFITDRYLYCYKVTPFGLIGTTYQRLVNMMFIKFIDRATEVYMDDMLVKSLQIKDHVKDLEAVFQILRRYRIRLNQLKCAFGMAYYKCLGYIVNKRKIEANLEKIKALIAMKSPKNTQRGTKPY